MFVLFFLDRGGGPQRRAPQHCYGPDIYHLLRTRMGGMNTLTQAMHINSATNSVSTLCNSTAQCYTALIMYVDCVLGLFLCCSVLSLINSDGVRAHSQHSEK